MPLTLVANPPTFNLSHHQLGASQLDMAKDVSHYVRYNLNPTLFTSEVQTGFAQVEEFKAHGFVILSVFRNPNLILVQYNTIGSPIYLIQLIGTQEVTKLRTDGSETTVAESADTFQGYLGPAG